MFDVMRENKNLTVSGYWTHARLWPSLSHQCSTRLPHSTISRQLRALSIDLFCVLVTVHGGHSSGLATVVFYIGCLFLYGYKCNPERYLHSYTAMGSYYLKFMVHQTVHAPKVIHVQLATHLDLVPPLAEEWNIHDTHVIYILNSETN